MNPVRPPNPSRRRFRQLLLGVALVVLIGIVVEMGLPKLSTAQTSQQTSFRISRLESENRMLRSRLSQLENQVNRLSRASGVSIPQPTPESTSDVEASLLASDPMFDRLATLVIETRQDVFALQDRLENLEEQLGIAAE